jgi:hypothetical protein
VLSGEQSPGPAEAGGDLVEDQQQPVFVGQVAQHPQAGGRVDVHPPAPLQHRLHDDPGERAACRSTSAVTSRVQSPMSASSPAGGRGAKTCSVRTPANMECIPPTGSHTLIAPAVSPW